MMEIPLLAALGAIGLIAVVLIGCVGIGGVLLVPALVYLGGIEVHAAIATCLWVFLFSVVAGARLAHAIAMPTLERIVSVVLVVTGAFLLARLAVTLATA